MENAINIIVAINLFVSMSANLAGAKKGIKSKLSNVVNKPKSYLQKWPPNVAAIVLILTIAGIFNLGTFSESIKMEYLNLRIIGLVFFITFSWMQIKAFKSLGEHYSQEILIFKNHKLNSSGFYKIMRHPQYLFQLLSDLGVGIALMGYIIIPIVIIVEIPLFVLRARYEDKILMEYFKEEFIEYKRKSGFIFPFFG